MGWPKGKLRGPREHRPLAQGETPDNQESNMADKQAVPNDNVTLSKEQFDALMGRVSDLEKKSKGPGIETTAMRLERDFRKQNMPENQNEVQKSIKVVDQPATEGGVMLHDKCPYCIKFHEGKDTILDQTNGGKYACRRCGKHWAPWAIFPEDGSEGPLPYNILLERNGGEKEAYDGWKKLQDAKAGLPVANIAR